MNTSATVENGFRIDQLLFLANRREGQVLGEGNHSRFVACHLLMVGAIATT